MARARDPLQGCGHRHDQQRRPQGQVARLQRALKRRDRQRGQARPGQQLHRRARRLVRDERPGATRPDPDQTPRHRASHQRCLRHGPRQLGGIGEEGTPAERVGLGVLGQGKDHAIVEHRRQPGPSDEVGHGHTDDEGIARPEERESPPPRPPPGGQAEESAHGQAEAQVLGKEGGGAEERRADATASRAALGLDQGEEAGQPQEQGGGLVVAGGVGRISEQGEGGGGGQTPGPPQDRRGQGV